MLLTIFYFLKDGAEWRKSLIVLSPLGDKDDEKMVTFITKSPFQQLVLFFTILKQFTFIVIDDGCYCLPGSICIRCAQFITGIP